MIYETRTQCVFCKNNRLYRFFDTNYEVPLGNFAVDSPNTPSYFMPYNVLYCNDCGTVQTEYIGDLNLIYENNFAGAFGNIRSTHNILFSDFILENKDISSIAEIGAGNGELSDILLEKNPLHYTIIDPSFCGNREHKVVLNQYLEKYEDKDISANTIIMSHVFEHFYTPADILKKLYSLKNIDFIYLSLPDLEAFIEDGTYHVLNSEHTFYVTNQFIKEIFYYFGFRCTRNYFHQRHSVFFEFIRDIPSVDNVFPVNKNTKEMTELFFNRLFQKVKDINYIKDTQLPVYLWPCSMHTLFVLSFGLPKNTIKAVLDNSPLKIGKYLYGFHYPCLSFQDTINKDTEKIILLTGGCYNKEVYNIAYKNPKNSIHFI